VWRNFLQMQPDSYLVTASPYAIIAACLSAVVVPALPKHRSFALSTNPFLASPQPPEQKTSHVPVAAISRAVIFVVAAYVAAQMLADIASLKIGVVAGLAVDMGTFIYPITFTLRDAVHKVVGKRNTQVLIICAAVINLFMVLYLTWAAAVPSDPESFGGPEFSLIFAPLWRIVIASILAEVVSELVDTEVYHWFVTRITRRYQWLRVLLSNSVSVPIDNLIFVLIAFSPMALPLLGESLVGSWRVTWEIFTFNLIVKYGMTLLSLPLIYAAPDRAWDRDQ
jgi:queuosine precursor transporter